MDKGTDLQKATGIGRAETQGIQVSWERFLEPRFGCALERLEVAAQEPNHHG